MRSNDPQQDQETSSEQNTPTASNLQRTATILQPRDAIHVYSTVAAGAGSGALASILCAPLDLIRTRLQVWGQVHAAAGKSGGAAAASASITLVPTMMRSIVQTEGWTGLLRGLGATLVTVPVFWGVYFPLYDEFKRHLRRRFPESQLSWIHMTSAVGAGIVSDVVCNPMFVVRTRLQTEALHQAAGSKQHGMIQTARMLYAEAGPRVFWRGMTANLLGLSHVAIQFPAYEQLKRQLRGQHKQHASAADLLLASGLSKMTASLITYPHEVIRSRMMDARSSASASSGTAAAAASGGPRFVQTCVRIYQTEGWWGFYAGLPVSLVRVIPNTCITFLTYELISRWAREQIKEYRMTKTTR